MTPLALIRHGPTEWNRDGRIQGRADVPLDAQGREAVTAWTLPRNLEGYRWVASPLSRAVETARILGAEPDLEPSLVEMDWGRWEGLRIEDLRGELGRDIEDNESRGLDFRPPEGESPRDVQRRIAPWLATVAALGQATVAVTHKGVIRAAYALASGWDMTAKPPQKLNDNAVHNFLIDGDRSLLIDRLNVPLEGPR
ncbi:MAG: histidine phosphatase family protein [Proteobacteria bacterium]|nr:histidine phosphatase family protein [Pseudomonadota bacterium]